MKIDTYHAERYSMVLLIKSNSQVSVKSDAAGIALAYKEMADNGVFLDAVVEKSGLSKEIVQELVRVSSENGTVVIKGYTSEDIKTDVAVDAMFEEMKKDFQNKYGNEYTLEQMSSGYYTGKDEDLIALQDLYIANGERYISERSSRERVLESMKAEGPAEEVTYTSAGIDAIKFGLVGCVFGIILAVIFGLLKDFMSKKLYHEKEIQKEWDLKCIAGEKLLCNRKKNFIDKKIESLYTGENLELSENDWVKYVTAMILQEPEKVKNVYLTGSVLEEKDNTRLMLLIQTLKENGIAADLGKNVISSGDTVEALKEYDNVVLAERAGESDWILIEEEIEILRNLNKKIIGFVMI